MPGCIFMASDEQKSSVEKLVSELVNEAFNNGMKTWQSEVVHIEKLPGKVFKSGFFSVSAIGEFTSLEGDYLKIQTKYVENAKAYAKLYEEKTGKRIQVELIE